MTICKKRMIALLNLKALCIKPILMAAKKKLATIPSTSDKQYYSAPHKCPDVSYKMILKIQMDEFQIVSISTFVLLFS